MISPLLGAADLYGQVEPAAHSLPFLSGRGERPVIHGLDDDVIQLWPRLGSTQKADARRVAALRNKSPHDDDLVDRTIFSSSGSLGSARFSTRGDSLTSLVSKNGPAAGGAAGAGAGAVATTSTTAARSQVPT